MMEKNSTTEFEMRLGLTVLSSCEPENEIVKAKVASNHEKVEAIMASYYAESMEHSISFTDFISRICDIDEELAWKDDDF